MAGQKRVDLIDLADHLGPAFGRETPELLLHHPERESLMARLPNLPPMGVGVEAITTDGDLAFRRCPPWPLRPRPPRNVRAGRN